MRTLREAIAGLTPAQLGAITELVRVCSQLDEHVQDLAFVHVLMTSLWGSYKDTPMEWPIVSAHKALLIRGKSEGLVEEVPNIGIAESGTPASRTSERLRRQLAEANRKIAELRAELDQRDHAAAETLRIREEDQARRDLLDTYPGAGAG